LRNFYEHQPQYANLHPQHRTLLFSKLYWLEVEVIIRFQVK